MQYIVGQNVNDCWAQVKLHVWQRAQPVPSRTGTTYRLPEPLAVRFTRPRERVLFDPTRNANPFFHLMESLWLLAGREDVEWIAQFNSRMTTFSQDGRTLPASYGVRWREHFGLDQLRAVEQLLRAAPATRRAVVQMWDGGADPAGALRNALDLPCNLSVVFTERAAELCMVVFNRSNDLCWGLFGANVVQFSMLQEYLARRLGMMVGWYEHITVDPHIYPDHWPAPLPDGTAATYPGISGFEPYAMGYVKPYPLMSNTEAWEADLMSFMDPRWEEALFNEPFFVNVARPVRRAWEQRNLNPALALDTASTIHATDWRRACVEWLSRRAAHARRGEEYPAAPDAADAGWAPAGGEDSTEWGGNPS